MLALPVSRCAIDGYPLSQLEESDGKAPSCVADVLDAQSECAWCSRILSTDVSLTAPTVLDQTISELVESARKGCRFCLLRRRALSDEEVASVSLTGPVTYHFSALAWVGRQDLQLIMEYTLRDRPGSISKYFRLVAHTTMKTSHVRTLHQSVLEDIDWRLPISWIAQCVKTHSRCQATPDEHLHLDTLDSSSSPGQNRSPDAGISNPTREDGPSRLIHLGADPNSLVPRLCELDALDMLPLYTTLSHCWGGMVPMSLKEENYQHYRKHLPVIILPRKFAEAMWCTKRLGIQYIWIDSLCIIQDSLPDWEREALRMRTIYRFSFCNIAAASTPNIRGSLFGDRANFDDYPVLMRPQGSSVYYCLNEDLWTKNIIQSPLLRRAWVIQEIVLARRILYFSGNQMFWECASLQACEIWPDAIPKAIRSTDMKLTLVTEMAQMFEPHDKTKPFPWEDDIPSDELREITRRRRMMRVGAFGMPPIASPQYMELTQPPEGIGSTAIVRGKEPSYLHLWPEIVTRYTQAALTFPERDKLVALSGLASAIHSPRDYLAGLWLPQLPYTLAWHAVSPTLAPQQYQAPSWSWACINSSVQLPALELWDGSASAILFRHDLHCQSHDRTGRITYGLLRLGGFLAKGFFNVGFSSAYFPLPHDSRQACPVGSSIFTISPDRIEELHSGDHLYFLAIHMAQYLNRVIGVVLRRDGSRRAQYRRYGYFEMVGSENDYESISERKAFITVT